MERLNGTSPFTRSPTSTPRGAASKGDLAGSGAAEPLASLRGALVHSRNELVLLFSRLLEAGKATPICAPHVVHDTLAGVCDACESPALASSEFGSMIGQVQEAVVIAPRVAFALRLGIGEWRYVRVNADDMTSEEMSAAHYLAFKERLAPADEACALEACVLVPPAPARAEYDPFILEFDMGPFNAGLPQISLPSSIGSGLGFLNKTLSAKLFGPGQHAGGAAELLEFLRGFKHAGESLLLSSRVDSVNRLRAALLRADRLLEPHDDDVSAEALGGLEELGFLPGWGDTCGRIRESLQLLLDIIQAPSPGTLEAFLARLPLVFRVVVLSPHGFFGQGVLGMPDTGGQVVYILDQVRALEAELDARLAAAGLRGAHADVVVVTRLIPESQGTTCHERLERINGTAHARILRTPFRDAEGRVLRRWVSRFDLWPFLERWVIDATADVLAELNGKPDFVVGNYSDGNMAATLMCHKLKVTQCNIAHALEKTKYTEADVKWRSYEDNYHFSVQFTADLLSMSMADFIVTSTKQEICGTDEVQGQYESYAAFTMPGLYRVVDGVSVFDPRFNVVSPGADEEIYFPFSARERRLTALHPELEALVYGAAAEGASVGQLEDRSRPLLFSMARLDKVKNLTGLVAWFGASPRLRAAANLLIVGGVVDAAQTSDREEAAECAAMHALIEEHGLGGQLRWVRAEKNRVRNGELYRYVADSRGAFVQPALYEAFGLTVVEAMACGLPTFATAHGGPAEIIRHRRNGFHIDPYHGAAAAEAMADFFERAAADGGVWDAMSAAAVERVETRFRWPIYAKRLANLCSVYTFWRHVTGLERREAKRYLEAIYILLFRRLVAQMRKGGRPEYEAICERDEEPEGVYDSVVGFGGQ